MDSGLTLLLFVFVLMRYAGVMDELIAEKYERAAATVYKLTKALATQRGVDELLGAYE